MLRSSCQFLNVEEGLNTRIFKEGALFVHSEVVYLENEKPLILYFKDANQWLLITNMRVLVKMAGDLIVLLYGDIKSVSQDFKSEKSGSLHTGLSKIVLTDVSMRQYRFELEPGKPFLGIYHVLAFIA